MKTWGAAELMELNDILPDFNRLSSLDKEQLLSAISKIIFAKTDGCPHCTSKKVAKYGKYKGKQRYMCNNCGKTFNDFTNSPLSNSKKPKELWLEYTRCMISRLSIRKTAKLVNLNIATSFFWRHKILEAVKISLSSDQLQGVIEADETYLRLNFKGNHKKFVLPRAPYKSGEKCKMIISKEKVCIAGALDNGGSIVMDIMCLGKISPVELTKFYNGHVAAGSILCTDCQMSYVKFAKDLKLKHVRIISGEFNHKPYTIKHVKGLQNKLMQWLRIFKGVATKYLSNYLHWFKLVQLVSLGKIPNKSGHFHFPSVRIVDLKAKLAIPV